MADSLLFQRVLLKISGESLQKGKADGPYDPDAVHAVVERIAEARSLGVEIALVAGAGNLWRGLSGSRGCPVSRVTADRIGMLGTVMNALCLRDACRAAGLGAHVHCSVDMRPFAEKFDLEAADRQMKNGEIVLFAGGTGCPFFTTDTASALRALETGCDAILKATKVNGIYTDDPVKNPAAKKLEHLTFDEALAGHYRVMDSTAFSLCADNALSIVVFNFREPGALQKILSGDFSSGSVVSAS